MSTGHLVRVVVVTVVVEPQGGESPPSPVSPRGPLLGVKERRWGGVVELFCTSIDLLMLRE